MKHAKYKIIPLILVVAAVIAALVYYLHSHTVAVLQPAGQVAYQERQLIFFALLLAVIVVVPTFSLTIFIAWKYRESNHRPKKYTPDFDHSRLFESIWWGIPIVIIGILSITVWRSAHSLDPYKPLASNKKPLTIQVIALDWKWLFIYPQQNIASVNFFQIPVNTPVRFQITSDTVMNSFWVPRLGGQIYAMPGMNTQLNLMASKDGSYQGSSANISGVGFSGMTFVAKASSSNDFATWVHSVKKSPIALTADSYNKLAKPSEYNHVAYYSSAQSYLYDQIVLKYMTPAPPSPSGAQT